MTDREPTLFVSDGASRLRDARREELATKVEVVKAMVLAHYGPLITRAGPRHRFFLRFELRLATRAAVDSLSRDIDAEDSGHRQYAKTR